MYRHPHAIIAYAALKLSDVEEHHSSCQFANIGITRNVSILPQTARMKNLKLKLKLYIKTREVELNRFKI